MENQISITLAAVLVEQVINKLSTFVYLRESAFESNNFANQRTVYCQWKLYFSIIDLLYSDLYRD